MEEQCSPLGWACYYQQEGADELKQSVLFSTFELEAAVVSAHDEISRKDDEIHQLKALLSKIVNERDELQANSQQLLFQLPQILADQDDPSDRDNNVVSDGCKDTLPLTPPPFVIDATEVVALKMPLPEKGKFLQAVIEAGPLIQTLLVAGPLPRWQHPPPQLDSIDIPPVRIVGKDSCLVSPTTNKRDVDNWGGSDFSPCSKYQKVCSSPQ